jgi:hypothetical protein
MTIARNPGDEQTDEAGWRIWCHDWKMCSFTGPSDGK